MCFDRNINGNKDDKLLEVYLVSCVTGRETHFNDESIEIGIRQKKNGCA